MGNYWIDRFAEDVIRTLSAGEKAITDEIEKLYRLSMKRILAKLVTLYDEIIEDTKNDTLLISDLFRYDRYYKMLQSMNAELKKLGKKEQVVFNSELTKMYRMAQALIGLTFDLSTKVNPNLLKRAVNTAWCSDGKNWSTRIWNNKTNLMNDLEQGLVDCVATGAKRSLLIEMLKKDFKVGFYLALRLARTEIAAIYNKAAVDKYKEEGIEKVLWLATEDERTCDECRDKDMTIIRLDKLEIGKNAPPLHPSDRCTLIPIVDKVNKR